MLEGRLGFPLDRQELVDHLMHLGCEVEGFAELNRFKCRRCDQVTDVTQTQDAPVECPGCGVNYREHPDDRLEVGVSQVLRMELLAVRPDIFDPGGLARLLRAYLGKQTGLAHYPLKEPGFSCKVDASTQGPECPRPAIACAAVRGLTLDDDMIKVVMKLQENLHWALGRDRKHASIGVYDLSTVAGPEFVYRGVEPEGIRFTPLGFDLNDPASSITPAGILKDHPKGTAFAHLLDGFKKYPLLQDAKGVVLSMPPIINSEDTRVRGSTDSFFVDVTGTTRHIANKTLSVLITSLLELQPDLEVEQIRVIYPDDEVVTPDLSVQPMELDPAETERILGFEWGPDRVCELLERMGHKTERPDKRRIRVSVPAYRSDIMHPYDLMEDVAIAYGYHNIEPKLVPTMTVGQPHPTEERAALVRSAMVGLGYWEVMTLVLTSPEQAYHAMRLEPDPRAVQLANPISTDQTELRVSLVSGLLETLRANTHRELPQKIFEVGAVTTLNDKAETRAIEGLMVAAAYIDAKAGAADIRAACDALAAEIGCGADLEVRNGLLGCYLDGRCGEIFFKGRKVGHLGEIHPEVLENFGLTHPVAVFELDLDAILV
jgi:phenylalanyl-tRNA synthetase beta chain